MFPIFYLKLAYLISQGQIVTLLESPVWRVGMQGKFSNIDTKFWYVRNIIIWCTDSLGTQILNGTKNAKSASLWKCQLEKTAKPPSPNCRYTFFMDIAVINNLQLLWVFKYNT